MLKDSITRSCIGQVVQVMQGRDAKQYAIVIQLLNEKYVLIVDGNKRKFDRPKKKNILHLKFVDYVSDDVLKSIRDTGRVSNSKVRYALNKFNEFNSEVQNKGE